ncbi:hypothetical protein K1W69_20355 [Hoeflea sp. WL0058]|uniref:Uncharacterized protein n=1 Tax=Flavimaribacter sediminis TaxID=2865987 RepID=A0AAE2ZRE6_9HYPH|nr:hypothetical protein [Flavimaribacter sediminis]MBW8639556.1 hypothetical protein [Flavimaribacter sediminis]
MTQETRKSDYFSFKKIASVDAGENGEKADFFVRTTEAEAHRRRFAESDVREILSMGGAFAVSALAPQSTWRAYCDGAARFRLAKARRKQLEALSTRAAAILEMRDADQVRKLHEDWRAHQMRRRLTIAAEYTRGKRPVDLSAQGLEHVKSSLKAGKGAILWANQFASQTLFGKRVLWNEGFKPVQISVEQHGFSNSSFGINTVNKVVLAAEDRYLGERLIFEKDDGAAVTRKVLKRLDDGALIIIGNNTFAGSSFVEVPAAGDTYVSMSTTALSMATRRGTPLHVMNIVETEPFQSYRVDFSPALNELAAPARPGKGRDNEAMAILALKARDCLLDGIRKAPEQFLGWFSITTSRFV